MELTTGAIKAMYEGGGDDASAVDPILQVLSVKKVNSSGQGQDRYRLILSDGEHFAQAMLTTTLNHLVAGEEPQMVRNAIVKLPTYAVNVVQNRRIVIILNVEVLGVEDKIGNPTTIENLTGGPGNAAAASASTTAASTSAPADAISAQPAAGAAAVGRGGSNASKTAAAKRGGAAQGRRGAQGGSLADSPIYPIESLSPYQNKWTIKARVTSKSDIRHWTNQRGEGKLFSVNLLDESGEIRATGFNEAVDRLYPIFEEGKAYRISRARVNIAKKQFTNLSNEYEITFEANTEVEPVDESEDKDVPQVQFNFTQLADLAQCEKDTTCDVIGIVQDNGSVSEITAKATQKQIKKRELVIVDRSQYSVRVTLWGRQAENWTEMDRGIVALKGVKVGDFGGRSLSVSGSSTVALDPDIPQAHELRGWYDVDGHKESFQSHSNSMVGAGGAAGAAGAFKADAFKPLKDVVDENLGMSDKPDFFATRATVTYVKSENLSYPACPTDRCNKKMVMEGNDLWRCEKCEMTYEAPQYRYIISMCINDYTSQIWVSGFNEVGQDLFGKTADEMKVLQDDDSEEYARALANAIGKMYNLTVKAKADSFGDQTRVRYQIQRIQKIDWAAAAKQLAEQIEKW
ncbi:replication factor A subunit protein RFA1 [Rhodotorula paludigena]|uniref:replication factor A subunit protein RFA1 n=1 Tax=Rhodotorula paludigena TaxID=86838 RepID=UPI003170ADB8